MKFPLLLMLLYGSAYAPKPQRATEAPSDDATVAVVEDTGAGAKCSKTNPCANPREVCVQGTCRSKYVDK